MGMVVTSKPSVCLVGNIIQRLIWHCWFPVQCHICFSLDTRMHCLKPLPMESAKVLAKPIPGFLNHEHNMRRPGDTEACRIRNIIDGSNAVACWERNDTEHYRYFYRTFCVFLATFHISILYEVINENIPTRNWTVYLLENRSRSFSSWLERLTMAEKEVASVWKQENDGDVNPTHTILRPRLYWRTLNTRLDGTSSIFWANVSDPFVPRANAIWNFHHYSRTISFQITKTMSGLTQTAIPSLSRWCCQTLMITKYNSIERYYGGKRYGN